MKTLPYKERFVLSLLLCAFMAASAQTRIQVKKDTVVINNGELTINNSTKNTTGYLYNTGNGITRFKSLDSTLVQVGGSQTITGVKKFAPSGLNFKMGFGLNNGIQTYFFVSDTTNVINSGLITSDLSIIATNSTAPGSSIISASSLAAGHRAVFKGVRARGTLTTPLVPTANDEVFSILGAIYDGSTTQGTAMLDLLVDGTVSAGIAPQRISFLTSGTTASNRLERLQVLSSGTVMMPAVNTITATSGTARGLVIAPALVSSANNDNMFGALFNPSYSTGSYTGQNIYSALFNRKIFISDGAEPVMIGANAAGFLLTANTEKQMRIAMPHYTQNGYGIASAAGILFAQSTSNQNIINIGGATTSNAATDIKFYTAATNSTTTGTLAGRFTNDQHLIVTNDLTARHMVGGSGAPAVVTGAAAGSGASVSITGSDSGGEITLTTGSGTSSGTLFTLTFASPYSIAPRGHVLDAFNDQSIISSNKIGIVAVTATSFTVKATEALPASTQYKWSYIINQ